MHQNQSFNASISVLLLSQKSQRTQLSGKLPLMKVPESLWEEKATDLLLRITDGMELHETLVTIQPTQNQFVNTDSVCQYRFDLTDTSEY